MRKLRLTGLMLGPSGELFRSEVAGPMPYDQWRLASWCSVRPWSCWSSQARLPLTAIATTSASTVLDSGRSVGLLSIKPIRGLGGSTQSVFAEGQTQSSRLWMPLGSKARTIPSAHGSTSAASSRVCFLEARAGGSSLVDPCSCSGWQRLPLKHQLPRRAISTSHKSRVTFSSLAWRGRVCHRSDSGLESLLRPVSISTMTKAITSVIVVACSSAWHFRRVPVRRHVLNNWPISARSA